MSGGVLRLSQGGNPSSCPSAGVPTLSDSEALRSSLMTADKASGLMPCSHSRTQMDRDSMSNPVFNNREISSRTVKEAPEQIPLW